MFLFAQSARNLFQMGKIPAPIPVCIQRHCIVKPGTRPGNDQKIKDRPPMRRAQTRQPKAPI